MTFTVPDMAGELVFNIKHRPIRDKVHFRNIDAWTHVAVANYLEGEPNNREDFWWAGHIDRHPETHSKTVKMSARELFSESPARVPVAVDNPTTLKHKVLFGYQGWYLCPDDGSDLTRWEGWCIPADSASAKNIEIDHWPDMSELSPEERFATETTLRDGRPAELFSSYIRKTVDRHFQWMEHYNLDGIFIGRDPSWPTDLTHTWFCRKNKVLQNVRAAAEAHGRVFAIEKGWGLNLHSLEDWMRDWMFLVDVLKITESPNYLRHKGKPVLVIQGVDEGDNCSDPASIDSLSSLLRWLQEEADEKYQATVQAGIHSGWYNANTPHPPYLSFDVLQPWFEKYSYEQADCYKNNVLVPGIATARAAGVGYMPVIFPGFSVFNRNDQGFDCKLNMIPRLGGKHLWLQAYNAISAGANMLYIAMFDELNEGTPMLKLARNADLPVGNLATTDGLDLTDPSNFNRRYLKLVTLDADGYAVPGDWYLQVAREIGRMMRGEIQPSPEMPLPLSYKAPLDTAVRPDIALVEIPGGTFTMGSDNGDRNEEPAHSVKVGPFQMSQHEITNAQYAAFLNKVLEEDELIWISTPSASRVTGAWLCDPDLLFIRFFASSLDRNNPCWISFHSNRFSVEPGKENWPVVYVTWYGARAFARRYGFDLPTEAEWEYACRGGLQYKWGTDNGTLSREQANYASDLGHPTGVGSYPANPFGLYDLSGNVSEWCKDWYGRYSGGSQRNPQGPDTGEERVRRGGHWGAEADQCRSASRSHAPGNTADRYTGFRVVKRPQ